MKQDQHHEGDKSIKASKKQGRSKISQHNSVIGNTHNPKNH